MTGIPNSVIASFGQSAAALPADVQWSESKKKKVSCIISGENISTTKGSNLHQKLIGITLVSNRICFWVEIGFWKHRQRNTQSDFSHSRSLVFNFA